MMNKRGKAFSVYEFTNNLLENSSSDYRKYGVAA